MTGLGEDSIVCRLVSPLPPQIDAQWSSEHMDPAHIIAVDHAHKALVVAIRGTMDITNDALADVVCATTEWNVRFLLKLW